MNEAIFKINIDKLVVLLLPINWRQPRMIAFLRSLATPIKLLLYDFQQNRKRNIYRVEHNWQICYMEDALNDEFDPQHRRITIDEELNPQQNYIYSPAEGKPKFIGTMYIRMASEYGADYDFIVNMNHAPGQLDDVRAFVNFYKLFGTRYKIINNVINLP